MVRLKMFKAIARCIFRATYHRNHRSPSNGKKIKNSGADATTSFNISGILSSGQRKKELSNGLENF
jgi:hypothetical protein